MQNICENVSRTIGRFVLEKMNVYNELSGVTTNQSGFNTLLKHYGNWKEAPVDALILGLFKLQVFYYNEIQRGYGGIGSYSLSHDFACAAIALDEVMSIPIIQPADIVSNIRDNQSAVSNGDPGEHTQVICTIQNCDPTVTTINDQVEDHHVDPNVTTTDDHEEDQQVNSNVTAMVDHEEEQQVNCNVTSMDDHEESHEVNFTFTKNDHEEDQEVNPTIATMGDFEMNPTVTGFAGHDDVNYSTTTTNEVTQLSQAR